MDPRDQGIRECFIIWSVGGPPQFVDEWCDDHARMIFHSFTIFLEQPCVPAAGGCAKADGNAPLCEADEAEPVRIMVASFACRGPRRKPRCAAP